MNRSPLAAGRSMRPAALLAALAGLSLAAPVRAQDDPRLRDALRLAQEGVSDSARGLVTRLLAATSPSDTLYPQMLYTMGLVSRSVADMRRNYSRVAVEHANSAWADDALYRLGLLDYAAGDQAGAVRQFERVRNDYPDSPLLPAAAEWAARALFEQRKPPEACAWLTLGLAAAGEDVELRNRLDFLNGRCAPGAAPPAAAPESTVTPPPTASTPGFAVQVGAVNSQVAADRIAADLKATGFTGYVVREAGLFKVRAGPFPDRAAATQAAEQIRRKLGGSPFIIAQP
jgi:tetratricopeptide (TPR) repeat protein